MGFNKVYLKDFDELVEEYNRRGHDEFRRLYLKYDAYLGMTDEKDKFLSKVLRDNEEYTPPKSPWYNKFFSNLLKPFQTNWYNKK